MPADRVPKPLSPWDGFLEELDGLLRDQVHVHCHATLRNLFRGL